MFTRISLSLALLFSLNSGSHATKPFVFNDSSEAYTEFARQHDYIPSDYNPEILEGLKNFAFPSKKQGDVGAMMTYLSVIAIKEQNPFEKIKSVIALQPATHHQNLYLAAEAFLNLKDPLHLANCPGKSTATRHTHIIGAYILKALQGGANITHESVTYQNGDREDLRYSRVLEYSPNFRYHWSLSLILYHDDPFLLDNGNNEIALNHIVNMAANLFLDWQARLKPSDKKLEMQKDFYDLWRDIYKNIDPQARHVIDEKSNGIKETISNTKFYLNPCTYYLKKLACLFNDKGSIFDIK